MPKTAAEKLAALPGSSSKTRLRKLVCSDECGYPPLRVSRSAIAMGLPTCVCGAVCWPWDLDDIELARASGSLSAVLHERHPLVAEFRVQWDRVTRGQHGHSRRGRLDAPDAIASLRVMASVSEDAAAARLNAARGQGAARAARLAIDGASVVLPRTAMTRESDSIPF